MTRVDRLSALLTHFQMKVEISQEGAGNLRIIGDGATSKPRRIELNAAPCAVKLGHDECVLVEATASWGGAANPLVAALPEHIALSVGEDDETANLLRMIVAEATAQRCGVDSVLNRLGEVLFVRLMRVQIETGKAEPGLLAGLADPRICRVIVAMHEKPGNIWRNQDLAEIAGLSLSQFTDVFQTFLGRTPQSYLRRWRMILARQDVERGDRIKAVAHRYGYASSEAMTRAFQREFGVSPMALRAGNIIQIAN